MPNYIIRGTYFSPEGEITHVQDYLPGTLIYQGYCNLIEKIDRIEHVEYLFKDGARAQYKAVDMSANVKSVSQETEARKTPGK